MLNEKMFASDEKDVLNYSNENFEKLFILIPKLREKGKYPSDELMKDLELGLYSSKALIDFDFATWETGLMIVENDNFDLSSLGIIDLCKLLTSVLESSNFIQGGIIEYLEDGTILKVLENLQRSVTTKG